jgi:hypothetical protein
MALTTPNDEQRQSIGAASQFIRTVARREKNNGWAEKARKLDDMLESGAIVIDDTLPPETDPQGDTDPKQPTRIRLPKDTPLADAAGKQLDPGNPDFIKLVGLLHRMADIMLGHGYIEAYGEESSFYQAVMEIFAKCFPELTDPKAAAVKKRIGELDKTATTERKKRLSKDPPPPAKKGTIVIDGGKKD